MHTANGVLLGFSATPKHIRYYDLTSHHVKLSTHHIIDEAHYGASSRPPGPRVLMDMYYAAETFTTGPISPLPYPMLCNVPLTDVYMAASTPLT